MVYLNFTKIAPPIPNDPFVNEVTQLNNNWDELETKLTPFTQWGASFTNPENGQERVASNNRFQVWTGAAWKDAASIDANWSAWTNMPLLAPVVIRPSWPLMWRSNSVLRVVEFKGGVLFGAAAPQWPFSRVTINADSAGAIPAAQMPTEGRLIFPAATALSSGTTEVAGAHVSVTKPGGKTFIEVQAQYMGGPGGGNFMMLDQVWWPY